MSVGWIVMAYLAIGALTALLFAWAVKEGIDDRGKNAVVDAAMRGAERAVGGMPGGMPVVLLSLALLWPAAVVVLIRNRMK
jgi:anti-sigma factor RsiW